MKSLEEKQRLKRIREKQGQLQEERKKGKQEARRRQREKAERKRINEFKSSTYQVVSILFKFEQVSLCLMIECFGLDRRPIEDEKVGQKGKSYSC